MNWTALALERACSLLRRREPVVVEVVEFAPVQDDAAAQAWLDEKAIAAGETWAAWAGLREVNSGWREQ